jgi:integrase
VKLHLAERTKNIYDVALRCHLKPALGALPLCDLDANRIAAYQACRKADGASARTLNKELQVVRQILKRHKLWANLQGDVRFERESDRIGKALPREDEPRLLKRCESNPLLHTVVTLGLNTALRRNEVRALRWGQIDLFKSALTVGKTKTEAGSGRLLPFNAPAYSALVKWAGRFPKAESDDYVFPACEDARIDCANRLREAGCEQDRSFAPYQVVADSMAERHAGDRMPEMRTIAGSRRNLRIVCAGPILAESKARLFGYASTIFGMRALQSSPRGRQASKPSWLLRDMSAGRCSNTTRTSEWKRSAPPWTRLQGSPYRRHLRRV